MSLLCSRHSWARARRTRRLNGDGWPDRDRFAAWFQGRAGEACAQVARCRGRAPQTLAGGASRQAGRILSGEGSWARPRQRGSEQAGGRGAWDLVLGAAGTEEAFPGRTGRRPSGERGGAGEGGGRQGGRRGPEEGRRFPSPPPVSPIPAAAEPVPQGPELPSFGVPCEGLPSSTQDSGRMGQAGLGGPPKRASTPWLWKLCLTYLDNESLHVYLVPRLWFWPHCLRSTHIISLDGFRVRLNPNTLAPPSPRSGSLAEPQTDDGHSVCVCGSFGNEHEPSEWRCGPCTSSVTCGPQGHGSHWGPATCAPHLALGVQEAKGRGVGGGAGLQGLLRM